MSRRSAASWQEAEERARQTRTFCSDHSPVNTHISQHLHDEQQDQKVPPKKVKKVKLKMGKLKKATKASKAKTGDGKAAAKQAKKVKVEKKAVKGETKKIKKGKGKDEDVMDEEDLIKTLENYRAQWAEEHKVTGESGFWMSSAPLEGTD